MSQRKLVLRLRQARTRVVGAKDAYLAARREYALVKNRIYLALVDSQKTHSRAQAESATDEHVATALMARDHAEVALDRAVVEVKYLEEIQATRPTTQPGVLSISLGGSPYPRAA